MGVFAQAENADNVAFHARLAVSEGSLPPEGPSMLRSLRSQDADDSAYSPIAAVVHD